MPHRDFSGARWIKSTRSNTQNQCVELARARTTIGIRDSKQPDTGPILEFPPPTLTTFITATKSGDLTP